MNDLMVDTFKKMDIYRVFEEYSGTAPKSRHELRQFQQSCIKKGYMELSEFIEQWRVALDYYIDREHAEDDEFFITDTQEAI